MINSISKIISTLKTKKHETPNMYFDPAFVSNQFCTN